MSGSAYSFTRKIIFLGRIVSPCTYTSFCRAITFDNQPWLFAWKRAASVSVSRVNSLYNPCDEFLVGFFPPSPVSVVFEQLPLYRCFGDVHRGVDTISREKLPDVYFRSCRAASKMNKLISKLQYRSCIYIYRATRIAERPRPHCERPKGHGTASAWFRWEYGLKYRDRIIIMER